MVVQPSISSSFFRTLFSYERPFGQLFLLRFGFGTKISWGVFNIEYGDLENGGLKGFFTPKKLETGDSKAIDGKLENKLKNSYLESAVGNWKNETL